MAYPGGKTNGQGGRLMQHLGISLWQWIFQGQVQMSLEKSQGIAIGQGKPLRLRIDIREPDLIALPWEIMQSQAFTTSVTAGFFQSHYQRCRFPHLSTTEPGFEYFTGFGSRY